MASILRHRRRRDFTVIPNEILRDARLSFRATGLLVYLLALPEGASIDSTTLSTKKTEGRDAIRTAFSELEAVGYARRSKEQDPESGQWSTFIEISDDPKTGFQSSGDRRLETRPSGNQALFPSGSKNEMKEPPTVPPRGTERRATPIPVDFQVSSEMRAWAEAKAIVIDLDTETEVFVDYWRGRGRPMKDWEATWRNWVRRASAGRGTPGPTRVEPRHPLARPKTTCPECESTGWVETDEGVIPCSASVHAEAS